MTGTDTAAPARPGALIGYAWCSTVAQDTEIQRAALAGYSVPAGRVFVDEGFTGTSTGRPGLDQALAAVHSGDTLIVPRLDRFARSVPDARSLADLIISRGARLQIGPAVYDPADPFGKIFFNILASFAEFEVDIIRLPARPGRQETEEGTGGRRMTAQPAGPAPVPDTGSYEVIHLGGQAAVVVPVAGFLRRRALERLSSAQELEDAEDPAALQEWRTPEAAGQTSYVPADEVRQRLGLTR